MSGETYIYRERERESIRRLKNNCGANATYEWNCRMGTNNWEKVATINHNKPIVLVFQSYTFCYYLVVFWIIFKRKRSPNSICATDFGSEPSLWASQTNKNLSHWERRKGILVNSPIFIITYAMCNMRPASKAHYSHRFCTVSNSSRSATTIVSCYDNGPVRSHAMKRK